MPTRTPGLFTHRGENVWWFLSAMLVIALAFINVSTATYDPGYPQYSNWYPAQQQQQHVHWQDPARGGSTMTTAPEGRHMDEQLYQPPKILLKHMSMALRITSEWNRRLLNGVNRFKFWKRKVDAVTGQHDVPSHHHPVNVHPTRAWHPPIPDSSRNFEDDELTIFHAKSRREIPQSSDRSGRRGVARWGPDLLPYLEHVVELLEIQSDGVEIPLAMIYMDRACSVETPRSNGVPPCPFCTPRTVHRLSLVALLLATQAVMGYSDQEMERLYVKVSSLGIPEAQLQQMVEWMRGALGDFGLMVTISQMTEWGQSWDAVFNNVKQIE